MHVQLDPRVAPALSSARLPLLADLDSATLLRVHSDEDAFEDWRRGLRRAIRQIESGPSSGADFADESRDVLDDELTPLAAEVEAAVSRSRTLRDNARDMRLTLGAGTVVSGAATVAGASPIVMAGAPGSAIGKWLLGSVFPKRQTGARAVVAHLLRQQEATATDNERMDRQGGQIFLQRKG